MIKNLLSPSSEIEKRRNNLYNDHARNSLVSWEFINEENKYKEWEDKETQNIEGKEKEEYEWEEVEGGENNGGMRKFWY